MDNHDSNLTSRQQFAILEILSSPSYEEARRRIKVAKGTLYDWLKTPAFQAELSRQRKEMIDQAKDRLKYGMTKAVDRLMELLEDRQASIQLRAAQAILEHGFKAIEQQEIEQRLKELEERILRRHSI